MARGDELKWTSSTASVIEELVQPCSEDDTVVQACWGEKLPYAHEIVRYASNDEKVTHAAEYETDLLIYDEFANGDWIPRVIIECKLGGVTSHDALTYSSKASSHKHVHPYLRYGILIGNWEETAFPPRLIRHGEHFDFMAVVEGTILTAHERTILGDVLCDEVRASRVLQALLMKGQKVSRSPFRILHRPIRLIPKAQDEP